VRARRIRSAVLIVWIAIGLLILSVAAIAVAVTARSEAFAFTALGLVMARGGRGVRWHRHGDRPGGQVG
jgi:hypothetical protein